MKNGVKEFEVGKTYSEMGYYAVVTKRTKKYVTANLFNRYGVETKEIRSKIESEYDYEIFYANIGDETFRFSSEHIVDTDKENAYLRIVRVLSEGHSAPYNIYYGPTDIDAEKIYEMATALYEKAIANDKAERYLVANGEISQENCRQLRLNGEELVATCHFSFESRQAFDRDVRTAGFIAQILDDGECYLKDDVRFGYFSITRSAIKKITRIFLDMDDSIFDIDEELICEMEEKIIAAAEIDINSQLEDELFDEVNKINKHKDTVETDGSEEDDDEETALTEDYNVDDEDDELEDEEEETQVEGKVVTTAELEEQLKAVQAEITYHVEGVKSVMETIKDINETIVNYYNSIAHYEDKILNWTCTALDGRLKIDELKAKAEKLQAEIENRKLIENLASASIQAEEMAAVFEPVTFEISRFGEDDTVETDSVAVIDTAVTKFRLSTKILKLRKSVS